eukprot:Hpha_TRINITY_DN16320_c1_g1::TRINITY_DN16320_c1_g1_i1::g.59922::m.59922
MVVAGVRGVQEMKEVEDITSVKTPPQEMRELNDDITSVKTPPMASSESVSDLAYLKKQRVDRLLDDMATYLIRAKPERPVHALRLYMLHDVTSDAAVAAGCIVSLLSIPGMEGLFTPTAPPLPPRVVNPFPLGSCVLTPEATYMGSTPHDPLMHHHSVIVGGVISGLSLTHDRTPTMPAMQGRTVTRRKSSKLEPAESPSGKRRTRIMSGSTLDDFFELDPISPPSGLYGDDGATLRRRSHAYSLSPKAEGHPGVFKPPSVLSPSHCISPKGSTPPTVGVVKGNEMPPCILSPVVRRKVEVVEHSEQGSLQGSEMGEDLKVVTMEDGVMTSQVCHGATIESGSESEGSVSPKQPKVKKSTLVKKLPFAPAEPVGGGLEVAEAEIRQCADEDEVDMLELHALGLTEVPKSLFDLGSRLVSLDISDNELSTLPAAVAKLPFLTYLSLKSNQLTSLPSEIGELSELSDIYLDHNMIESLPPTFRKLQKLRVLGLDWNDLSEFPEQVLEIQSLEILYMVENPGVTQLPPREKMEGAWKELEIQIDNSPKLVRQWKEILSKGPLPCVKIDWNSVFPDLICGTMYLGSLRSAQQVRIYEELGITHLASIGRELTVVLSPGMEQLQLNVDDMPGVDLTPHFDAAHEFIDQAMDKGEGILVHCFKGQSRSATVVVTYLMKKRGMTRDAAVAEVKKCRKCINPNPGFMDVMARYEKTLGIS